MGEVLVLVEHAGGSVKQVTTELLTWARSLGTPAAVWVGPGCDDAAAQLLGEFGAASVHVADDARYLEHPVAPKAEVLAHLVSSLTPSAVLIAATAEGKEVAGRLAVKTSSGLITDAVGVDADLVATQSVFGGSTVVHSKVTSGTPIITMRANSIEPQAAPAAAVRADVTIDLSENAVKAKVTGSTAGSKAARPELAEASIVVSGGRGVGSAEGFGVVESLADVLNAAVGASRAATDAGWYSHQFQVGQTGKTVSPQLYLALGISGAIQHRAGMQTSKTIVVVNSDREAPMFDIADFGVVGDLFEVVPQLMGEIAAKSS